MSIQNNSRKARLLSSIRTLKKKVAPTGKMILFGSQARGDSHDESDWDLLFLLNKKRLEPSDYARYAVPFVDLGWENGEYFSVKLYTADDWEQRKGTPFYKNVTAEGIEI